MLLWSSLIRVLKGNWIITCFTTYCLYLFILLFTSCRILIHFNFDHFGPPHHKLKVLVQQNEKKQKKDL